MSGHNHSFHGTCPLYIVYNAFQAGAIALNFNIGSFVIGVNVFFELSAATRVDYKQMQEFTDVISHFIQKYSSTRWVTLRKICVKVLEQYQNLQERYINVERYRAAQKNKKFWKMKHSYHILHLLLL